MNSAATNRSRINQARVFDQNGRGATAQRTAERELCSYGHPLDGMRVKSDTRKKVRYCLTCDRERKRRSRKGTV